MHASASGVITLATSPAVSAERSHHRRRVSKLPRSVLGDQPGEGKEQTAALREEKQKQKKGEERKKSFRRTEEVGLEITSRKKKNVDKNERKIIFNVKKEEEG